MNNLEIFLASRAGKRFFNFFYSWGAAVVIIGALFKIIHLPGANQMLMIGMITEAVVFFISAFDPSHYEDTVQTVASSSASGTPPLKETYFSPEYKEKMSLAAKNMDSFAQTMNSLNEVSLSLLDEYKQMTDISQGISEDSQGFTNNMKALNTNVLGVNNVYEAQLKSISDQIATIKYINESLDRIKGLYDGVITDSSVFREETEKMTKQIEALNNVYARLLQAMTSGKNI